MPKPKAKEKRGGKYLERKMDEIETEVAAAVSAANMIGCLTAKCTDGVIKARDEATNNIQKIVRQIIKRFSLTKHL